MRHVSWIQIGKYLPEELNSSTCFRITTRVLCIASKIINIKVIFTAWKQLHKVIIICQKTRQHADSLNKWKFLVQIQFDFLQQFYISIATDKAKWKWIIFYHFCMIFRTRMVKKNIKTIQQEDKLSMKILWELIIAWVQNVKLYYEGSASDT